MIPSFSICVSGKSLILHRLQKLFRSKIKPLSLNKIKDWIESLNDKVKDSKFLIIGNKCDLKDKLIPENIIENQLKDYIFIGYSHLPPEIKKLDDF